MRAHGLSGADRYIRFGLHARFFNVEGTDDMVVDTLGMGTLFMPDLQLPFHILDPNRLVHHACSTALYILENDCPIQVRRNHRRRGGGDGAHQPKRAVALPL